MNRIEWKRKIEILKAKEEHKINENAPRNSENEDDG